MATGLERRAAKARQEPTLHVKEQAEQLNQGLRGHYAYEGRAGNVGSLLGVYRHVEHYWRHDAQ